MWTQLFSQRKLKIVMHLFYCCMSGECKCVCTLVHVWQSEFNPGCQSLPSIFRQGLSKVCWYACHAIWPGSFQGCLYLRLNSLNPGIPDANHRVWQTWPHCYIFPVFTEKSLKLIKPILPPLCFWVFFQVFCNFAFGREVCEALWINFEDSVRPQNYVFAYWLIACGCASVLALPDAKAALLIALSWPLCQQPAGYVCIGMFLGCTFYFIRCFTNWWP